MLYNGYDYMSREETSELNKRHKDAVRLRGNSWVYFDGACQTLVSYDTTIMSWNMFAHTLYVNHDAFEYSNTTCRHISEFLRKYVDLLDYYTVKGFITDAYVDQHIDLFNGQVTIVCV